MDVLFFCLGCVCVCVCVCVCCVCVFVCVCVTACVRGNKAANKYIIPRGISITGISKNCWDFDSLIDD
jgi:hypothetical protein